MVVPNTREINDLEKRLDGISKLFETERKKIMKPEFYWIEEAKATGFHPAPCGLIGGTILSLKKLVATPKGAISFDLGCGDGCWALMAAAAGYNSYGIDVNPFLLNIARKNHELAVKEGFIDPKIDCRFAEGNIYHNGYRTAYEEYVKRYKIEYAKEVERSSPEVKKYKDAERDIDKKMPSIFTQDPYRELGVSIGEADIVYSYPWIEVDFLYKFFEKEVKKGAMIAFYYGVDKSNQLKVDIVSQGWPGMKVGRKI